MNFIKTATALLALTLPATAWAAERRPDQVIEFYDSGTGPIAGPYGGDNENWPVSRSLDFLTSDAPNNGAFLSLPTDTFITLGFTTFSVIDGAGFDFSIEEDGGSGEFADVFVSSNNVDFSFLGQAASGGVTGFDLSAIGYQAPVTAIRIKGRDVSGTSPGFDLIGLRASSIGPAVTSAVPEPTTWMMMISGFGVIGGTMRRRAKNVGRRIPTF